MFASRRTLAVDVGASKVVLAEFVASGEGPADLADYGIASLGVESERETDLSAYIVSALREILRERGIRPAPTVMSISGQVVFPRYVKLPSAAGEDLEKMIRLEAEQNVPFPIDEVVWDYQIIATEEGLRHVMLVAAKTDIVTRMAECVIAAGLEPLLVDAAPMALYNAVRFNYPDLDGCTMVLDIGARASTLIFVEGNRIFIRSIPVAGYAVTVEIMKAFEVGFPEAEKLKQEHAFVALGGTYGGPEDTVAERISKIARGVVTRLHAEINRSINFYRSQQEGSPPVRALLTGGSSIMPHLDTFFREKLGVEVDFFDPFRNLPMRPELAGRVARDRHLLGEVVGLSLRRTLRCPVEISLMPPVLEARQRRRRRQPFFAVAALGVAMTLLCWWVYFLRMRDLRGELSKTVTDQTARLKAVAEEVEAVRSEEAAVRAQVEDLAERVRSRTRWAEILAAIHACLPEGVWLQEVTPGFQDGMLVHVDISGRGFKDKFKDVEGQPTAAEHLLDRLRRTEWFDERSEISRLSVLRASDYARDFSMRLVLRNPWRLR